MAPTTTILETLQGVLDLLVDPVDGCALQPPPCRVALYPGGEVPWDTCEIAPDGSEGQLWGAIQTVQRVTPGGGGDACNGRFTFAAEVGVTRCGAKLTDDGQAPAAEDVQADAWQQAADADQIRAAIQCCAGRTDAIRDLNLISWTPTVGGGCVGGFWTVEGSYDDCC